MNERQCDRKAQDSVFGAEVLAVFVFEQTLETSPLSMNGDGESRVRRYSSRWLCASQAMALTGR
ncbi:MAG: hypothetical protein RBU37_25045 [Myxococcota bacterium]|jgi:hypothetical protein|nr:hypothetical protein [Myxococcota bacterium]